jgi:hypothetical protein
MSYINFPVPTPVFPAMPTVGWSVKKSPVWPPATTALSVSGRERRAARQSYPTWQFELTYQVLREETQNDPIYQPNSPYRELELISSLFLTCLGGYGEFYFADPDDSTRLATRMGTGDGKGKEFFFYINYPSGQSQLPTFFAPPGAVFDLTAVYINGSLIPPSYYSWGITSVVFISAVQAGDVVTGDVSFYYRCRFDDDVQNYEQFFKNIWAYPTCKFSSVKP